MGVGEIEKEIWETIAEDEHQCLPQVLFSFSCVGRGHLWSEETRFPHSEKPQGPVAEDVLTESRGRLSPKRKCMRVYV